MNIIDPIEKMDFELDNKKFMFLSSQPFMKGKNKKLVTGIAMIDIDSGDIVAEDDLSMSEFIKEDNYIILAKFRKKLINQYKAKK